MIPLPAGSQGEEEPYGIVVETQDKDPRNEEREREKKEEEEKEDREYGDNIDICSQIGRWRLFISSNQHSLFLQTYAKWEKRPLHQIKVKSGCSQGRISKISQPYNFIQTLGD
jgi:hypothetical protein